MKQKTGPRKGAPNRCYHAITLTASKSPSTTWPMPGLPATFCTSVFPNRLDLGDAPGRANTGDKITLVASALASDCIDDADALQRLSRLPGQGASTAGFRWGHVRPGPGEPRVAGTGTRQAGAGPGDGLLDLSVDHVILVLNDKAVPSTA